MKHKIATAGIILVFALFLCLQGAGPTYGAEQAAPGVQQAEPQGMMRGPGMMRGQGMMEGMMPPNCPCARMMGGGRMEPMARMGHPMMLMKRWPGMGMGMMGMYADPKTRGQMMEIRGRMLQEIGKLMEERGKEIAAGKK